MSPLTISVIIPFFSNVQWLEEAIESVLMQTMPPTEILVIDDGSTEDLTALVEKYGASVTWIRKENGGPASARNLGIERSGGDYIAFLDSDDLWWPRKLEIQSAAMVSSGAVWSHTAYETFTSQGGSRIRLKEVPSSKWQGSIFPRLLTSHTLATPTMMVKGDVFRGDRLLRFPVEMRYGQDGALWVRLAMRYRLQAIEDVLASVRIRGTNAALRARVQIQVRAAVWQYLVGDLGYSPARLPRVLRGSYMCCIGGSALLRKLARRGVSERSLERLSKCLYALPWAALRLLGKVQDKERVD